MRHRNLGRKLGRNSSHRDALFANMVTSLFLHNRIETTVAKAKELRRFADDTIGWGVSVHTLVAKGDKMTAPERTKVVHAKRMALALHALIEGKYPQDHLYLIGFSDYARKLEPRDLTAAESIERVYGTNMPHAFLPSVWRGFRPEFPQVFRGSCPRLGRLVVASLGY